MSNQAAGDSDIAGTRTEFQNQLLKVGGLRTGIFVYFIIVEHPPLVHTRDHFIINFKGRKVSQMLI